MRHNNPKEAFYWEEVRRLVSLPLAGTIAQKPTKIILHGDRSADQKFQQVLKETLQQLLAPDERAEWIESTVFTAATGAAELAKRKPYWGLGP